MIRLQSLVNLDQNLRKHGSRLFVLRGDPTKILPQLYESLKITHVYHEIDTEPFWQQRDFHMSKEASKKQVAVVAVHGHTLYDPIAIVRANKKRPPLTMNAFLSVRITNLIYCL